MQFKYYLTLNFTTITQVDCSKDKFSFIVWKQQQKLEQSLLRIASGFSDNGCCNLLQD